MKVPLIFLLFSSISLSVAIASASVNISTESLTRTFEGLKNKSEALSPELKIYRAQLSQKRAESFTQLTSHFPNAKLVVKKEKDFFEDQNSLLQSLGLYKKNSSWGINYEWPLFNFSQIETTHNSYGQRDKSAVELHTKESQFPIAFTAHFLNYLMAKYKSAAIDSSLKKAHTGKKEAQIGFDLGQKTKIDVLRSEANLVSLNAKKTTTVEEELNAKNRFAEYSGLEKEELNFVEDLAEEEILALIDFLSQAPSDIPSPMLQSAPEYKILLLEEKINTSELALLTRNEYPDLRIQGSYTSAGDNFDEALHRPVRSHSVALVLTIPLFSGGSFTSAHFEKYFAKKQIEYSTKQKKLQLENDLNTKQIKIKALRTLISSLALNVSQFEELYRLTLKSYQLGKSSLLELLEVQDNLLDSKIQLAQNKIQFYSLAQNYLWQAGL